MQLNGQTFLRVLKGAPLSVLIGLWVHGGMGQGELRRCTGYDEKTVRDALEFLDALGLVARAHYRKWVLAVDVFGQLPLAGLGLPAGRALGAGAGGSGGAESGRSRVSGPDVDGAGGAETGDSVVSAAVVSVAETEVSPLSDGGRPVGTVAEGGNSPVSAAADGAEAGNSPVSEREAGNSPASGHYPAAAAVSGFKSSSSSTRAPARDAPAADVVSGADVAEVLQRLGIGVPMCHVLAALPHVTADYAQRHVAYGRAAGESLALVIHRMRSGDPAPVVKVRDPVRAYVPPELEDVVVR